MIFPKIIVRRVALYTPAIPVIIPLMIWKPWTLFTVALAGWMSPPHYK